MSPYGKEGPSTMVSECNIVHTFVDPLFELRVIFYIKYIGTFLLSLAGVVSVDSNALTERVVERVYFFIFRVKKTGNKIPVYPNVSFSSSLTFCDVSVSNQSEMV